MNQSAKYPCKLQSNNNDLDLSLPVLPHTVSQVGGHCDVYVDPKTQFPVDVGVQVYINDPVVTETFASFNLSSLLVPYNNALTSTIPISVSPVKHGWISNGIIPPPNVTALMQAVQLWFGLWQTRFAFLDPPNSAMPDFSKVPNDMLRILAAPFGDLLDALNKEFEPQYGPNVLRPLEEVTMTVVLQGPGPYREVSRTGALAVPRRTRCVPLLQCCRGKCTAVKPSSGPCTRLIHLHVPQAMPSTRVTPCPCHAAPSADPGPEGAAHAATQHRQRAAAERPRTGGCRCSACNSSSAVQRNSAAPTSGPGAWPKSPYRYAFARHSCTCRCCMLVLCVYHGIKL